MNLPMERIVHCISSVLEPHGFKRRHHQFVRVSGAVCSILQVQKSVSSTLRHVRFTINLGAACGPLLAGGAHKLSNVKLEECHLRLRIGGLLQDRPDMWWDLTSDADSQRICLEVSDLLTASVLPYLAKFSTPESFLELWEKGESPGLTELQRVRYLEQLRLYFGGKIF